MPGGAGAAGRLTLCEAVAMLSDVSVNWFVAQSLAAVAAYLVGQGVGRRSTSWGEIGLALIALFSVAWAARSLAQDAIVRILPLDFLVYTEGTLIVPFFTALAGIVGARCETQVKPRRAIGPLLCGFGLAYLGANGAWMLAPRAAVDPGQEIRIDGNVVLQSRDDSCVAAALASALRSPGVSVAASEAEMAELADVRAGYGATMVRALRAAERRLLGESVEARLVTVSAADAAALGSPARPALVTLRSGLRQGHMVAVLGRAPDGSVLLINPSGADIDARPATRPGLPYGASSLSFEEFRRRYTGSAIVFTDRPVGRWLVAGR